jgi:hypothetical protein
MHKAVLPDQVLPPEKGKCVPRTHLQNIAAQLKTEFAAYHQHENDALKRAVVIGLLLIQAKNELKHGEFIPWIEQNIPEYSRFHCARFQKLADVFLTKQKLNSTEALALSAHANKQERFNQLILDFSGGKSQADLFEENHIKSRERKLQGGDNVLTRWLRENGHADLEGTPRVNLPLDVLRAFNDFEIKRHLKQHEEGRPARIRREYEQLRDALSTAIMVKKTYSHLYRKELELLYEMLTECRSEIAGALKMPDEEFRNRRLEMIKSAAEKADTVVS